MILLPRDRRGRFLPLDPDPFDPRFVLEDDDRARQAPMRIPLDDREMHFALVDAEDYAWLTQWRWSVHRDGRTKLYARREEGRWRGRRIIYMHRVIAARIGEPPSPEHVIVDHLDGDGLNNRRANLRWATPRENERNKRGLLLRQLALGIAT